MTVPSVEELLALERELHDRAGRRTNRFFGEWTCSCGERVQWICRALPRGFGKLLGKERAAYVLNERRAFAASARWMIQKHVYAGHPRERAA
jgi:hypothetical protein